MLSENKKQALHAFLGALPGAAAARLARIIEIDRLHDGSLPHDEILDFLRPALRKYGERNRVATPLRYFCLPFEDFLFNGARRHKRKGCISRSIIVPLWNWLGRTLIPGETQNYADAFKVHAQNDDLIQCDILAAGYWKTAATALSKVLETEPDEAKAYFGSDFLYADAREIAIFLMGGTLLQQVKALFPKPAPEPNEEVTAAFRSLYECVESLMPDLSSYLPVVAMGRLEKPWHAVRLASSVTNQTRETLIAATDIGLVGEILFDRMDDAKAAIIAQRPPEFDPDQILDNLTEFALLSSAITKEVGILRTGIWGKRLLANRNVVASIMDAYMERAPKEVLAAIPLKSSSVGAQTLVPNFAKEMPDATVDRAERYAKIVAGCRYLAAPASFAVKYDLARRQILDAVRFYDEAMLSEIRAKQWPDPERVEARFRVALALTRILFGNEEANMFERRGQLANAG